MSTNMKEINLNEMEQANGGFAITAASLAAIGLATACTVLVVECARFGRKIYKDITKDKQ